MVGVCLIGFSDNCMCCGIVEIDMKSFLFKSIVVFVLATAFYFITSPYHNCLIDGDISHTECLKHTGW